MRAAVGLRKNPVSSVLVAKGLAHSLRSKEKISTVAQAEQLRCFYQWQDARVDTFLGQHPHLIRLLGDALEPLGQIFGFEVQLKLFLSDLGWDENDLVLFAQVKTGLEVREAMSKLKEFLNSWFVDRMVETEGKLTFDVI